jgi:hypothetical protein
MQLSVVILVCRKDADAIERTLFSLRKLDAEILIYDTTRSARVEAAGIPYHAHYFGAVWEGFERIRYRASRLAQHDWIMMLHTGEEADSRLQHSLQHLDGARTRQAYRFRFKHLFNNHWLKYGEWGNYSGIRLANRSMVSVADQKLNEAIFYRQQIPVKTLKGSILHCVWSDRKKLETKLYRDALCAALRLHRKERRAGFLRLIFSPLASFFQSYFMKLGCLDGWQGFVCARLHARYTYLKYIRLGKLNQASKSNPEAAKHPE